MKKDKAGHHKGHIKRVGKDGVVTAPRPNYGKAEGIDSHREATKKFIKEEY